MKMSILGTIALPALLCIAGTAQAAPSRGSNCADVNLELTCEGNILEALATLTNCARMADTFTTRAVVVDSKGAVAADETMSIPLGGGRTFSLPYKLNVSQESGTYSIKIEADADKGTGYDSLSRTIQVPCP